MNCLLKCHAHPSPAATEQAGSSEEAIGELCALRSSVVLPALWSDQSCENHEYMHLCRISSQASSSTVPLMITHCLKTNRELSWSLFMNKYHVDPSKCGALRPFPRVLTAEILSLLLTMLDGLSICAGQPDIHFIKWLQQRKARLYLLMGRLQHMLTTTPVQKLFVQEIVN